MSAASDKRANLAAQYGWSISVLKSDKGLWAAFNRAVANTYSPERFIAEIRGTAWFKNHQESWRQDQILRRVDPATRRARLNAMYAQVRDQAQAMGAVMSAKQVARVADNIMMFGWNAAQIRNVMADYVGRLGGAHGVNYLGEAERTWEKVNSYALQMGVKLGNQDGWIRSVARGNQTADDLLTTVRTMAEKAFPQYQKEFRSGLTLSDIASPYTNSMSQILEINPKNIDMFDPSIRSALTAKDPKTGHVTGMSISDFENNLRSDPRWTRTANARQSLMGVGYDLLRSFGMAA